MIQSNNVCFSDFGFSTLNICERKQLNAVWKTPTDLHFSFLFVFCPGYNLYTSFIKVSSCSRDAQVSAQNLLPFFSMEENSGFI